MSSVRGTMRFDDSVFGVVIANPGLAGATALLMIR